MDPNFTIQESSPSQFNPDGGMVPPPQPKVRASRMSRAYGPGGHGKGGRRSLLRGPKRPNPTRMEKYQADLQNAVDETGARLADRAQALKLPLPVEEFACWNEMFDMVAVDGRISTHGLGIVLRSFGLNVIDANIEEEVMKPSDLKGWAKHEIEDLIPDFKMIDYIETPPLMLVKELEEMPAALPLLLDKLVGSNVKNLVPSKPDGQPAGRLAAQPKMDRNESIYHLAQSYLRTYVDTPRPDAVKTMMAEVKTKKMTKAWAEAACILDDTIQKRGPASILELLNQRHKISLDAKLHEIAISLLLSTNDEYKTHFEFMVDTEADTAVLRHLVTRCNIHFDVEVKKVKAKMVDHEKETSDKIQDLIKNTRRRILQELERGRQEIKCLEAESKGVDAKIIPDRSAIENYDRTLLENTSSAKGILAASREIHKNFWKTKREVSGMSDVLKRFDEVLTENWMLRRTVRRISEELDAGLKVTDANITKLTTMADDVHGKWDQTYLNRRRKNVDTRSVNILAQTPKKATETATAALTLGLRKTLFTGLDTDQQNVRPEDEDNNSD